MHEERVEIEGIPTRLFTPEGASNLLLLGHGGGHSKDGERFVRLAREYASSTGLAVVCIDAVDHGERRPQDPAPGLPRQWHSSATPQMVADWRAVSSALTHIGPPLGYVGFSMGAIFGLSVVAAVPEVTAAVFFVGGLPGDWVDDPPLHSLLLAAAASLTTEQVLMINKSDDELFPPEGVRVLFDAVASSDKRLRFWPGGHDDWPAAAIRASIDFLNAARTRADQPRP